MLPILITVQLLTNIKIRNNIFAHKGAGKALYINNPLCLSCDYNNLYAAGANIVQSGSINYSKH